MHERSDAGSHDADGRAQGEGGHERFPRVRKRMHGPYRTAKCGDSTPRELLEGIQEFNRGQFFEQHETLELLWRRESDDVRYLYQGILLVGVGCYHLVRGNAVGARIKLNQGLELLRWFEPTCQGVDVSRLVVDVQRCFAAIKAPPTDRLEAFELNLLPRVYLLDGR